MDRDGEITTGNSKPGIARPTLQSLPNITKEVMLCKLLNDRERGCRSKKTQTVSNTLKACAEDELVNKEYKEMVSPTRYHP